MRISIFLFLTAILFVILGLIPMFYVITLPLNSNTAHTQRIFDFGQDLCFIGITIIFIWIATRIIEESHKH